MNRVRLNERNFCLDHTQATSTKRTLCGWIGLLYENQEDEKSVWNLTAKLVESVIGDTSEYDCIDEAILDAGMSESQVTELYHKIMDALYGIQTASKDRSRNEHALQDHARRRSDPDANQGATAI